MARAQWLVRLAFDAMPEPVSNDGSQGLPLCLLGAPRLLLSDRVEPLERRTAALLTLLALNGPTPRPRAAALVWPEADERRASNSLRQRIFKLRQAAGREVIVSDRLIALAPHVVHDLHDPLPRLADDPEACRGELLGELDFTDCEELQEWVEVARRRWRGELSRALAEQAARLEHEGRVAAALQLAGRLVELDPTVEHAHRRVMRLHYLRGDRAAALAAFERCRDLLRRELGVEPDRETLDLQQLLAQGAAPLARVAPVRPVTLLRPPRLVGREVEWQRLQQARMTPGAVLVLGEAGIGKSRLLADFAAVHQGLLVAARPGDAAVPYATLVRLLRALAERVPAPRDEPLSGELARLLPEMGPEPSGRLDVLYLRSAVEQWLRRSAEEGWALRVLDDLQFADAATLELLPILGAGASHWLLASRASDLPAPLRAWCEAEDLGRLSVVRLGPLDTDGVRQLIESLRLPGLDGAAWAPALWRHTGGNPMFLLETLRSLMTASGGVVPSAGPASELPVPQDVGALIERRLRQLSPDALALARVAALAGQDFTPELGAAVLERRVIDLAEPWRELEAAQVIRDQGFAHDLVLEATQRSVPPAVARAMHRAMAGVLQRQGGAPARLAAHWERGGEPEAACSAWLEAAAAARSRARVDEEWTLLHRALDALQAGDAEGRRCQVLHQAVISSFELGRYDAMRQEVEALEQAARSDRDRLLALDARVRLQAQELQFEAMLVTCAEAEPLAGRVGSGYQRSVLAELKATALARLNRPDEALAALQVGFAWIEAEPDHPWVSGFLIDAAATMSYVGRHTESGALARRAYAAAERHGTVRHMHAAAANIALVDYLAGDIEGSAAGYERCRSLAMRFGGDGLATWVHGADLAFCLRWLGRYGEALRHAEAHAETCRRSSASEWWRVCADLELVRCHHELGQHARALAVLGTRSPAHDDARYRWLLLRCRVQADAPEDERRRWIGELQQLAEGGMRSDTKRWSLLPELCALLPPEEVVAMVQRETEVCRRAGAAIYARPMQLRLAEALLAAGRTVEAHAWACALLDDCGGRTPYGMYLPEAWWILHRVFAAAGDSAAAADALGSARRWILETALPNVPETFRESFLQRNKVNRTVLTAAEPQPRR